MARKKAAAPAAPSEIQEKTLTVFEVNGETYSTLEEAQRVLLQEKVRQLTDKGEDSLNECDIYKDEVVEWIANHLDDLLALRSNS